MTESASHFLGPWSNFYIMTGSSAGALIGLMFVVITLVTGEEKIPRSPFGVSTFSTPTVVHFCAAFLVSAVLSAPWRSLIYPAMLLGLTAVLGILYVLLTAYRMKKMKTYHPDLEDWSWNAVVPLAAYATVLAGAIVLPFAAPNGLFAMAAGVVAFIFTGIHNAWDIVTFLAVGEGAETPKTS